MNKQELEAIKTVLQAILIECDKGNIISIRDIAEFTLKRIQGAPYE